MTVSQAMIGYVSPFTVSDSGEFTTAMYTYLSAVAKARLDQENPGLSETLYDHCHALLICHLFVARRGELDKSSVSVDGYSYARSKTGSTTYLEEYLKILSEFAEKASITLLSSSDSVRNDAGMMPLDENDAQVFPE